MYQLLFDYLQLITRYFHSGKKFKYKNSRGGNIYISPPNPIFGYYETQASCPLTSMHILWLACAIIHKNKYPNINHCATVTMMPVCFQFTFYCFSEMHSYSIYNVTSSLSQHENIQSTKCLQIIIFFLYFVNSFLHMRNFNNQIKMFHLCFLRRTTFKKVTLSKHRENHLNEYNKNAVS